LTRANSAVAGRIHGSDLLDSAVSWYSAEDGEAWPW